MTSNAHSPSGPAPGTRASRLAEAARYTLLRRLAPSMRHHLVVNLQPIGMIYEVMERRLKAPSPDLAEVRESAHKINSFARAALGSCVDVVTWLAPDDSVPTTAEAGVRECLGLVATSLAFRGYNIASQVDAMPGEVRRAALRTVLTGALLHATDVTEAPADVTLSAQAQPHALVLTLALRRTDGDPTFMGEPGYRPLEWDDLQALAAGDGVELAREDASLLRMSFPWLTPPPGAGRAA